MTSAASGGQLQKTGAGEIFEGPLFCRVVNNDGGMLVGMLVVVLLCAAFVLVSRRNEIPLVGDTFS